MTKAPRTQDPGPDTSGGTTRVKPESLAGISCTERLAVLAGPALAAAWTAVAVFLGTGMEIAGILSLAAIAWTVVSSLALALRRGIRRGDWSAFRDGLRHACPPDTRAEGFDWDTRTGSFAYMRIREDRERLLEDDGLHRNHDSGL